ncbi:MAG: hypothetical protein WA020_08910 [Candidatus Acidiferrales bacterium]
MTQIIFALVIGCLLLGVMLYWFLQGDVSNKVDLSEARNALGRLQSKFLPLSLVDRILDYDDFVFVDKLQEPDILRLLETERKMIAAYWLRHTRQQVRLLMTFYVKSARHNAKLAAALEFNLAFNYCFFLMACNALQGLIWLRGPFHALKVARCTMLVTARLCAASEKILTIAEAQGANMQEASGHRSPAGG